MKTIQYIFLLIGAFGVRTVAAQQINEYVTLQEVPEENFSKFRDQSKQYLDLRTDRIEKLYKRQDKQIRKSLKRLARKEQKLKAKYKKKDSLLRARLRGTTSFDSLKKVYAQKKATTSNTQVHRSVNKGLDSLLVIKRYTDQKITMAKQKGLLSNGVNSLSTSHEHLDDLKSKLAIQQEIQQLSQQHGQRLKNAIGGIDNKADLKGLSKELFYFKGKIQAYKDLAKEPEKLERLALEYLQGTPGFETAVSNGLRKQATQGGISLQDTKPEDLARMGFQTKSQVQGQLKKKFNLNSAEKINTFKNKTTQAKAEYDKLKTGKESFKKQIAEGKKEGFKANPLRNMPLVKRIEKNFNWQVNRAANGQPAIANFAVQLGFRHTPRLTYQLLAGTAIGLGKGIRDIRISYQGVRLGANTDWNWIWGFSGQVGYEVLFKEYTHSYFEQDNTQLEPQQINETKKLRHTAYAGLMKTYKINKKYRGTVLIGYDFLWNKYDKRSPLIIRFGWKK